MPHFRLWQMAVVTSLLVGCATAGSNELSVGELKQEWKRYDGKVVRVRGTLDACVTQCNLCPDPAALAGDEISCLPLAFAEENTPNATQETFRENMLFQRLYRFTTLTVEARFLALCMIGDKGEFTTDVVCTGWPINLDKAKVISVAARQTSNEVPMAAEYVRPLVEPSAPDAAAMLTAMNETAHPDERKVFLLVKMPKDLVDKKSGTSNFPDGLGCVCLEWKCDGKWPVRYLVGMDTPANPFHCWALDKMASGWRVLPSF
jgi:hypothetical protein